MGPQPPQPGLHWRIWAAEAAGTGLMVLAIVAAATLSLADASALAQALPGPGARFLLLGLLVAPCIALIAVSPIGRLSGAHINPAVTLAFWALGWVSRHDLAGYVAAQLAGGLAGAVAARALLPESLTGSIGGAVTHPGSVSTAAAVALEAAMTALLLGVVLAFVSSRRLTRWTPLALVPLITAMIWLGSPWTGASLNPVRSEGPALAFWDPGRVSMSTGSGCSVSTSTAVPGQARTRQSGYEPKLASDGSKIQEPGFLEANPATGLGECASERLAGVGEDDLVHVLVPAEVVVLVVAGQEDHLLASRRAPYELEEPFRLPNAYFTPRTEVEDIAEQDELRRFPRGAAPGASAKRRASTGSPVRGP